MSDILQTHHTCTCAHTHMQHRHHSGCQCSMGRWRPTEMQLTPLFDGSLTINGRLLGHSNKHSHGRYGFREFLDFLAYKKLLGRTEMRTRERKCFLRYEQFEISSETIEKELRQVQFANSDRFKYNYSIHTCQPKEKFSRDKQRPAERSEPGFGRGVQGFSPEIFKNL